MSDITLQRDQTDAASKRVRRPRSGAGQRGWAGLLVAPLALVVVLAFVIPVCGLLLRAVSNQEVVGALPLTMRALSDWDGGALPPDAAFDALASDLLAARDNQTVGELAKRLNLEMPGFRSAVMATSRKLSSSGEGGWRQTLISADGRWGELGTWRVIKRNSSRFTPFYLLSSLDLQRDDANEIASVPPNQRIFLPVLARTLLISSVVTLITVVLGFPVAYLLATNSRMRNVIMVCILLPFATSILVRTIAWVLLLQSNGLVIQLLTWLHIADDKLQLLYNRFGVLVAMTHIQLPYTILPIYAVMRRISPDYYRAAISLGASPVHAFVNVYLPQVMPGVLVGSLITFILSLGYYITPALVGGPYDQMVSYYIAQYVNTDLNWGQAAALSIILILMTILSLAALSIIFYRRLFEAKQLKLEM